MDEAGGDEGGGGDRLAEVAEWALEVLVELERGLVPARVPPERVAVSGDEQPEQRVVGRDLWTSRTTLHR